MAGRQDRAFVDNYECAYQGFCLQGMDAQIIGMIPELYGPVVARTHYHVRRQHLECGYVG